MGNDIAGVGVNFETDWPCYSRAINTFPGAKPYFNKIVSETKPIFAYNACINRNQCICWHTVSWDRLGLTCMNIAISFCRKKPKHYRASVSTVLPIPYIIYDNKIWYLATIISTRAFSQFDDEPWTEPEQRYCKYGLERKVTLKTPGMSASW